MLKKIDQIEIEFSEDIKKVQTKEDFEDLRIKYISRKGLVASLFVELKEIDPSERRAFGQKINSLKNSLEKQFEDIKHKIFVQDKKEQVIDLSLPGRKPFLGRLHPLTIVLNEIKDIFFNMGFRVEDGPEIETDFFNFEALNIPKDHPARDMQDTLYITEDIVLRTHTSPVQIRVMQASKPPINIIAPGRVYRRDTPDASHSPFFHQVEGLVVDEGINFGDLKGVVTAFAHKMFGSDI